MNIVVFLLFVANVGGGRKRRNVSRKLSFYILLKGIMDKKGIYNGVVIRYIYAFPVEFRVVRHLFGAAILMNLLERRIKYEMVFRCFKKICSI